MNKKLFSGIPSVVPTVVLPRDEITECVMIFHSHSPAVARLTFKNGKVKEYNLYASEDGHLRLLLPLDHLGVGIF